MSWDDCLLRYACMYKGTGIADCSSRIDPVLADCGSMCDTDGRCVQYFMFFKKMCVTYRCL